MLYKEIFRIEINSRSKNKQKKVLDFPGTVHIVEKRYREVVPRYLLSLFLYLTWDILTYKLIHYIDWSGGGDSSGKSGKAEALD